MLQIDVKSDGGCTKGFSTSSHASHRAHGFSLIELISIMIIVAILAVSAAPRFFDNSVFQSRGALDQVKAALRYGQKAAIAQNHNVRVDVASAVSPVCNATVAAYVVTCTISSGISWSQTLPSAVTFDALGKPYSNATTPLSAPNNTITVGGTVITIEPETGYVH